MICLDLKYATRLALAALALLLATACSTTSRLGENDVLYTGVKYLKYHKADTVPLPDNVKDQIFEAINVKPNNPLYSPYLRSPLPIGLWVYNHMDPNAKGFKGWFYKVFSARPVLIRRVNPDNRVEMINTLLQQNGYFTSSARYKLNIGKNPKKASISYDVDIAEPYRLGRVSLLERPNDPIAHIADSVATAGTYLHTGSRYCLDSLNNVRIDITNRLRNSGYYYFKPEYFQYLADSVSNKGTIDIKLVESNDIPNIARQRFLTRRVIVDVKPNNPFGTTPDTTVLSNGVILIKHNPVRIRNNVFVSNMTARTGRPFRVNTMDRLQLRLSRLGIFSDIDMEALPVDSVSPAGDHFLDLKIECVLDKPWEVKLEAQATSKSNSYIGPGLVIGLTHNNIFGGGEQLSFNANASYEWQTGHGSSIASTGFNSYEFGGDIKLAIPRLLAPRFVDRSRRYINWTRFSIGGSIMSRPKFFRLAQVNFAMTWEWHSSRTTSHELSPFKLTYNKLLSTTDAFYEAMAQNPSIILSFNDQFVPKLEYKFTYDADRSSRRHVTFTATVAEAGNLMSGLWALAGKKNGEKQLFGTPFSQFVKGELQLVHTWRLTPQSSLVWRGFIGALYPYGNSKNIGAPYREYFYAGGANSIRAFSVRSIGPGSYRPENRTKYSYFEQIGSFKFETNLEYRFPLFGNFYGAVFLDAGNVWELENYEYYNGGKFRFKNFFKELALGTGLGLRYDLSMLVLRADLGFALHAPYDTGYSGYFNMGRFKDMWAFHLAIGYPF